MRNKPLMSLIFVMFASTLPAIGTAGGTTLTERTFVPDTIRDETVRLTDATQLKPFVETAPIVIVKTKIVTSDTTPILFEIDKTLRTKPANNTFDEIYVDRVELPTRSLRLSITKPAANGS